jgi:hypothetical protein
VFHNPRNFILLTLLTGCLRAQTASPDVFDVLLQSATTNSTVSTASGPVSLQQAVPSVFTESKAATVLGGTNFGNVISVAGNYRVAQSVVQVTGAINTSIATALSVIPLASPASGVISRVDPTTGAPLSVSSTLGTILTERAETIGKHKFYLGVTHQDFHFTSLDNRSLNGLRVLYPGGDPSNIALAPGGQPIKTDPATFDLGLDVRLSQDVAFLTYGVTDRLDVSVGLPMVHAAVASTTYNGQIYSGPGDASVGNCWCVNTFTPGVATLTEPTIGQSSLSKTGFGDLLVRVKGTVLETPGAVVALGVDVRAPTGDERNYLGTGATAVKPFVAMSLYSKPIKGIVFAPHINLGWQYSGTSILGGQLQGTSQTVTLQDQSTLTYVGAPFTATKGYLPDVFSWAVGTEIAAGRRNTIVVDILGNQIGLVHGSPSLVSQSVSGVYSPVAPYPQVTATGLVSGPRTSFGEYSGSFGYKTRIIGNLVFTFNALVRFDNNGLTARFVPLYGLGYSF